MQKLQLLNRNINRIIGERVEKRIKSEVLVRQKLGMQIRKGCWGRWEDERQKKKLGEAQQKGNKQK